MRNPHLPRCDRTVSERGPEGVLSLPAVPELHLRQIARYCEQGVLNTPAIRSRSATAPGDEASPSWSAARRGERTSVPSGAAARSRSCAGRRRLTWAATDLGGCTGPTGTSAGTWCQMLPRPVRQVRCWTSLTAILRRSGVDDLMTLGTGPPQLIGGAMLDRTCRLEVDAHARDRGRPAGGSVEPGSW
jgi:hypothetical protein